MKFVQLRFLLCQFLGASCQGVLDAYGFDEVILLISAQQVNNPGVIDSLKAGEQYYMRVITLFESKTSQWSAVFTDCTNPEPPTGFSVTSQTDETVSTVPVLFTMRTSFEDSHLHSSCSVQRFQISLQAYKLCSKISSRPPYWGSYAVHWWSSQSQGPIDGHGDGENPLRWWFFKCKMLNHASSGVIWLVLGEIFWRSQRIVFFQKMKFIIFQLKFHS